MAIRIASDLLSLYPPMMPAKQNGGKISRNGGRKNYYADSFRGVAIC